MSKKVDTQEASENPVEEGSESKKEENQEDKIEPHHIESGFHHMLEAEKVKQNPKLLAKVKEHAKKQGDALHAIHNFGEESHAKSTKELRAIGAKLSKK